MIVHVDIEPYTGRDDQFPLFVLRSFFGGIGERIECTMEVHVECHAQGVSAGQPAVLTPHAQDDHGHDGLFAHNRAKEGRSGDTLCFLETAVERLAQRTVACADLGRYSE